MVNRGSVEEFYISILFFLFPFILFCFTFLKLAVSLDGAAVRCCLFYSTQDYFDIVKTPMDLTTIRGKLESGQYEDPWQYMDDMWLMFNNAWIYNRKGTRVYKYCSKV